MLLATCAGNQARDDSQPAQTLLPGTLVEAGGRDTVMVRCTGIAEDPLQAMDAARRGCVDWYVRAHLLHGSEGVKTFAEKEDLLFQSLDRYISRPEPGGKGGRSRGVRSQERTDDDRFKVELIAEVNRAMLIDFLKSQGIAGPQELPKLTVQVKIADKTTSDKCALPVQQVIIEQLINQGLEVLDPVAVKTDAQLTVSFSLDRQEGPSQSVAYGISVIAIESRTGKQIAAKMSVSVPRSLARPGEDLKGAMEAAQDSMVEVSRQLDAYRARLKP
jgi:hypothetical protein